MTKLIKIQKQCSACRGWGYISIKTSFAVQTNTCPQCRGAGVIWVDKPVMGKP